MPLLASLRTGLAALCRKFIICIRLPFAALLFLAVSAVRERDRLIAAVRDPKTLLGIVLFAIFGILLTQYSYLTAISLTNAGTGTVMERLGLVLLTILVCAMARRLPRIREVVGVLLAVAGTFFIATKGSFDGLAIPPEALVWGFLLACGFVGYTLLPEKLLAKWGSFIVTGLGMLVAGVIICAVEQPWSVPVEFSPGMVAALAAMVVLGTFLAYLFYLQGAKEAGAEILPVVLDGTKTLIKKNLAFNWGNRITVRVLPPVPAERVAALETHELMQEVHERMCTALGEVRNEKLKVKCRK